MEDFFGWLTKFDASTVIVMLSLSLLIILLMRIKGVSEIVKLFNKNKPIRSCGDCILILFGITEKHRKEFSKVEDGILKNQMSYFEQKVQELTLWLTQSFQEDLAKLSNGQPLSLKMSQFANYQEALKNSLHSVKDEIRKSFKENGFVNMSNADFDNYVKSKLKTLLSISQIYLSTFYIQNDDTIVSLKYRYDKLDMNKLSEMTFDVFEKAKSIVQEASEKEKELDSTFKTDIDNFTHRK